MRTKDSFTSKIIIIKADVCFGEVLKLNVGVSPENFILKIETIQQKLKYGCMF